MAKPDKVTSVEQTEYGPIYYDDHGYGFRQPNAALLEWWQKKRAAGYSTGWVGLPDGWYMTSQANPQRKPSAASVLARDVLDPIGQSVGKTVTPIAWLLGAGALLVFVLKRK